MRTTGNTSRLLKNGRARELTTDFLLGLGIFLLVTGFAGVHEAPALPAPLAKTEAMIAVSGQAVPAAYDLSRIAVTRPVADTRPPAASLSGGANKTMLIVMALLFSTLSAITLQLWRSLRREYASPRRKRGRGQRYDYGG